MRHLSSLFLVAALAAVPASADVILTPHVGVVAGGDADDGSLTYGGSLAFMGDGPFGFEIDVTHTPDFFGFEPIGGAGEDNMTSAMGSLLIGTRLGESGHLYAAAGAGLLKFRLTDEDEFFDIDRNDFGVNVGAGAIGYVSDNVGLRADVRYFADLQDPEPDDEFDVDFGRINFWRITGGVSIRF